MNAGEVAELIEHRLTVLERERTHLAVELSGRGRVHAIEGAAAEPVDEERDRGVAAHV